MGLDPKLVSRFNKKAAAGATIPATDTAAEPGVSADTTPDARPARKSRAKPAVAQADVAASSDDMTKTIVIPGEHGPISITGDARDLCDVSTALNHS